MSFLRIVVKGLSIAALALGYLVVSTSATNIVVSQTTDANLLASTVLAVGTTALVPNSAAVTSHSLPSDIKFCAATFTDAASASGFSAGVVLSTGWVGDLVDPNDNPYVGVLAFGISMNLPDGKIGLDPCDLKFTFQCPLWATTVQVQYVFASEDYGYRSSGNSLAFIADEMFVLLNGNALNNNIATVPGTNTTVSSLSINSNTNSQYFSDNSQSTLAVQANGLTQILTATGNAKSGGMNTIEFIVADIQDKTKDSWLMIQPGSLTCLGCPSSSTAPVLAAISNYQSGDTYSLGLPVGYVAISVDWGDGITDSSTTHQYMTAVPVTYVISVISKYADPSCFTGQTFTSTIAQPVSPRTCTYPTVSSSFVGSTVTVNTSSLVTTTTGGFTITTDWTDGDAVATQQGQQTTVSHTFQYPGAYNVSVNLSDQRGCSNTTIVAVNNCDTAPLPVFSSLSTTEGGSITVRLSNHPGRYRAQVNWGDGSAISNGATTYNHTFVDNGSYTVTVEAYTDTGCSGTTSQTVTVANAQPSVTLTGPFRVPNSANVPLNISITCNDAGLLDVETLYVNWGDGSAMEQKKIAAPAWSNCQNIPFSHTYRTSGTYLVYVAVLDKDLSSIEVKELLYITAPTSPPSSTPLAPPSSAVISPTSPVVQPPSPIASPSMTPVARLSASPIASTISPPPIASPSKSPVVPPPFPVGPSKSPVASSPTSSVAPKSPTAPQPNVLYPTVARPSVGLASPPSPVAPPTTTTTSTTTTMAPTYTLNPLASISASGTFTSPAAGGGTVTFDLYAQYNSNSNNGNNNKRFNFKYPTGSVSFSAPNVSFVTAGNNGNFVPNSLYVVAIDASTVEAGFIALVTGTDTTITTKAQVHVRKTLVATNGSGGGNGNSGGGSSSSTYSIKVNIWKEDSNSSSSMVVATMYSMPNFVTFTPSKKSPTITFRRNLREQRALLRGFQS